MKKIIYKILQTIQIDGAQRSIKVKKNIILMLIIKGISLLISLLYVPLLLHSMTPVNYGIWLTLTSIVSWISMCDIGVGNGLRNKLSEAIAVKDYLLGKKYVSTAYAVIFIIMGAILFIFIIISNWFLSWNSILNAPDLDPNELRILVNIVFTAFCANFVLSLLNSVLYALQSPATSSLISTLGQLGSFIIVFFLVKILNVSSLLVLGSIISILPVIIMLICSVILYNKKYQNIAPTFKLIDSSKIKDILSLGIKFFILQLITIVLYQSNNLIITHTVSNEAVVEYNIAYKYMNILLMIYTIIVTPLWSATTEAYVQGDILWIRNTVNKLNKLSLIFILIGLIMLLIANPVYCLWLNISESNVSFFTTLLLYLYTIGNILYANYGYILNGIGKLNLQIIVTGTMAIIYIPTSYLLGTYYGLNGILTIFAIVAIMNFIWSKLQFSKIISRKAYGIWNK